MPFPLPLASVTAMRRLMAGVFVAEDANNTLTAAPKFWVGTQADYDALTPDDSTIYLITE